MTTQLHIASQYLAAAQISFLDKKDDDSHTNIGFNIEKGFLETRSLNDAGYKLALDYQKFALHWIQKNTTRFSLNLNGKTHHEVLEWIQKVLKEIKTVKPFKYDLHYELPYSVTEDYSFSVSDTDNSILQKLMQQRALANTVLQDVLQQQQLKSDVRIWPHHFDTGAFSIFTGKDISVGFGMAIPDSMHDDYYFYISGYKGHDALDTSSLSKLTYGNWYSDQFKGAILPVTETTKEMVTLFFNEAISILRNY